MNKNTLISIVVIVVAVVIAMVLLQKASNKPNPLDTFAACLGEKGATFYGAFWCPHCADQKKLFGTSAKLLPYTECSTPDSKGVTQVCLDAGIKSYPTWIFADGTVSAGTQELETLAEKTGCALPSDEEIPVSNDTGQTSNLTPTE